MTSHPLETFFIRFTFISVGIVGLFNILRAAVNHYYGINL